MQIVFVIESLKIVTNELILKEIGILTKGLSPTF